jgi:hypothetical protein
MILIQINVHLAKEQAVVLPMEHGAPKSDTQLWLK